MKCCVLRAACCVVLLLAACRQEKPAETEPAAEHAVVADTDLDDGAQGANLLSLAHGASIVSRTAEATLESSAVHAIDGDWQTFWRSPPAGAQQTFVISLAARARIHRLGAIVPPGGGEVPPQIRFESSDDGVSWSDVATFNLERQRGPQVFNVPAFEAGYLRVRTLGDIYYSSVHSLLAYGEELAPPQQPPIEGCWTINGMPARFTRRGTSVTGVIGSDPPMYVAGGTDGRVVRAMWIRGPMWGHALLTLDPRRRALSGVRWHEAVRSQNSGDAWFGTPLECGSLAAAFESGGETAAVQRILRRARMWVAYGDSALDTLAALVARSPQQYRIVVHDPKQREALRKRGVQAEVTVAPSGATTEPQRVMADGVELHLR